MSYQSSLRKRIKQLEKAKADVSAVLYEASKKGTDRAIAAATETTPPKDGMRGTNTVSGELKAHWATDSQREPQKTGDGYQTILGNNMQYASFVNDGHRMDKHFVPGLYINPYSGELEFDMTKETGIVVGTKTKYVKGAFMTDKAIKAFQETVLAVVDAGIEETFK